MNWIDINEESPEPNQRLIVKVRRILFEVDGEPGQEIDGDVEIVTSTRDGEIYVDQKCPIVQVATHWAYLDK
jgi:hypothetical protein